MESSWMGSSCYQHEKDKGVKEWIWGSSSDFTEVSFSVDGIYKGQYDGSDPATLIEANNSTENKVGLFA